MEEIVTKFDEKRLITSEPKEMVGKYLAKRLLRTWTEDFIDETSGEIVPIERNEVIMERGEFLTNDNVSQIMFYIETGDVKEVEVSDQKRDGFEFTGWTWVPWMFSLSLNGSRAKVLLFAQDIEQGIEIVRDYAELNFSGNFSIMSAKKQNSLIYIDTELKAHVTDDDGNELVDEQDESKIKRFYKLQCTMSNPDATENEKSFDDDHYNSTFLLKALDANDAEKQVSLYLAKCAKETAEKNNEPVKHWELSVDSAAPINISYIVPKEFSLAYREVSPGVTANKPDTTEDPKDESDE
jgi:stress response protein YsnF